MEKSCCGSSFFVQSGKKMSELQWGGRLPENWTSCRAVGFKAQNKARFEAFTPKNQAKKSACLDFSR
jgi:hypothetical protein